MPTAVGTNTVTSLARRFILPTVTDNTYASNILLYRLMKMNKKLVQGGYQIEVPLMYARFNTGMFYRGLDVWPTTPSDTVKNAVFDWKQAVVTWAIDGLTMIKMDSPEAIANILVLQSKQAEMELAEVLAAGLFSDGVADPKSIDGTAGLFGVGSTVGNNNYGGITRTSNSWWNAGVTGTTSTSTLSVAALQSAWGTCTVGGQHPTLILSRQDQYNRYYALNISATITTDYPRQPMGHDELLAQAGFTNLLFNNCPWVVDSHVPDGVSATNSAIYMFNENVLYWVVSPRADFYLRPFVEPPNQDGMVAAFLYAGNLVAANCAVQGGILNVNA